MAASTQPVTEAVALSRLHPAPWNPRLLRDTRFKQLCASLQADPDFLWERPVLAMADGTIYAGNMRYRAAEHLGWATIPARLADVPEHQAQERALRDNNTFGEWQEQELAELLVELQGHGTALDLLGFPDEDLTRLLESVGALGDTTPGGALDPVERASLADRFLVPPFSVLDARQGYWQARKRAWLALGIQSELGREGSLQPTGTNSVYGGGSPWGGDRGPRRANAARGGSSRDTTTLKDGHTQRGDGRGRPLPETASLPGGLTWATSIHPYDATGQQRNAARTEGSGGPGDLTRAYGINGWVRDTLPDESGLSSGQSGTSIFDPVLCELVYRWWCPPTGAVLDPFAGGSVRGIVASLLGRQYTGIDLSDRQLAANAEQAATITPEAPPRWLLGDSRAVATLAPGPYDLLFSCPPYADLERYSDDPRDLSTLAYADFLAAYQAIIAAAVGLLAPDRFACFVVGDVRDGQGLYRNFVSDTIAAFHAAGARLYNEAILVTACGSLPIRVGKQFVSSRKLGKTHQNVLVFVKGDPKKATVACGPVEIAWPEDAAGAPGDDWVVDGEPDA